MDSKINWSREGSSVNMTKPVIRGSGKDSTRFAAAHQISTVTGMRSAPELRNQVGFYQFYL